MKQHVTVKFFCLFGIKLTTNQTTLTHLLTVTTSALQQPNACNRCHRDRPSRWSWYYSCGCSCRLAHVTLQPIVTFCL